MAARAWTIWLAWLVTLGLGSCWVSLPTDVAGPRGNVDGGDGSAGSGAVDGGACLPGPGQKICGGHCVSTNDPFYGCAHANCHPCNSTHGTATCGSDGGCAILCASGYADCDKSLADGCEIDVDTDTQNCGGCGVTCTNSHGTASCNAGQCSATCSPGFGDCDRNPNNGCESSLDTAAHCGDCGTACTSQQFCNNGTCTPCGSVGQACCPSGSSCAAGEFCTSGRCARCGEPGEYCCSLSCSNSGCASLAGANRCYVQQSNVAGGSCTSGSCPAGTICAKDANGQSYCVSCGSYSEPCCAGSACSGFTCTSAQTCD